MKNYLINLLAAVFPAYGRKLAEAGKRPVPVQRVEYVSNADFPLALTHRPKHPSALLVVTVNKFNKVEPGEPGVEPIISMTNDAYLLLFQRAFNQEQNISMRYQFNKEIEAGGWKFYAHLFIYNVDMIDDLDHLCVMIDPLGESNFFRFVGRINQIKGADAGTGSLEEALATYFNAVRREIDTGFTRVTSKDQYFPKGAVGWVFKDEKQEGATKLWIQNFTKPVLKSV